MTHRIVLLTRNPISEAIVSIAATVGRETVLVEHDEEGRGVEELESLAQRTASDLDEHEAAVDAVFADGLWEDF